VQIEMPSHCRQLVTTGTLGIRRNPNHERLNKAGADLVLLKENIDTRTACGKFMLTMLAAVGAFEAELVGERTRDANAVKRARKEKLGGSMPQGYQAIPKLNDSGEPVLNGRGKPVLVLVKSEELEYVVAEIVTLKAMGMTWQAIVDGFNERGIKTPNNKAFSVSIVRRIVSHSKRAA
jgi:DNA invertase Pin-like site-specific DNA recombinase